MSKITYEIMHQNRKAAAIDETGHCRIYSRSFMPYNLYFEEETDIDSLVNNLTNFQYWCASRVLTPDRKYAKEILNSIGMTQAVTDRERAKIALSYRCASLTDVFWVRMSGEDTDYDAINLYDNHLDRVFIDIALRGRQYTADNKYLARDLSTSGCFPKAWQRTEQGFRLLKDGDEDAVERELLASRVSRCFDVSQVLYEEDYFDGVKVTASDNMTTKECSIVSMEAYEVLLKNQDKEIKSSILALDKHNYYMMNVIDYLIGNTDRHWGNWGVLVDNLTNQPKCLHKLMDFNRAFHAYDDIEGANCQTAFCSGVTQRDAAVTAVREIGLNQIKEVDREVFVNLPQYYEMFCRRLELLRAAEA